MTSFRENNTIHPTAIIGSEVSMGTGNIIGPYCVLNGKVTIGDNNHFETGIVTDHIVSIGNNCKFYPYVSLGFAGEMGAKGDKLPEGKGVVIEDKVTIREFVNVHAPYWWDNTKVSEGAYIMNKAYLAHDVQIGKGALINAGVRLGGRACIHDYANVGMGATVHQRSIVGMGAMVGMSSAIKKAVPPFAVVAGVPARILKFNLIGAKRRGFDESQLLEINEQFPAVLSGSHSLESHPILEAIEGFLEEHSDSLITFR